MEPFLFIPRKTFPILNFSLARRFIPLRLINPFSVILTKNAYL